MKNFGFTCQNIYITLFNISIKDASGGDHPGHYHQTGNIQNIQNILIQQYPLVSAGSQHIPYSTSNNDGAFHSTFQHSSGGMFF